MIEFKYLHCNKCFRTSTATELVEFLMTECGHIVCKPCLDLASSGTRQYHSQSAIPSHTGDSQIDHVCPVCKTQCACISLSAEEQSLHPEAHRYFRDPQEILGEAIDAMKFQESNKQLLLDHLMDKVLRQRQVLIKVRDEMVHIKAVKSEVQALKEENERLKRQIKEQAVAASTYAMPPPQHFGDKYHDLKKQDQGVGPPDHTRPMFNKPRKNSVQLPIVVPTPEKSYSGSHPEQPHVQIRVRPHASIASGVRGGKPGSKPTTPVPPARLSLQARPTSESPRVMFQPTVNGAVAQSQFRSQPQPQYPQSNAHPMLPSNVTQMSNQMCGPQHQQQHQHQHHQSPSFQSPSVINRHYQVSSAPTPAPVLQYSLQHQTPHPSYPNRIPQSFDTPIGIYCTPADPGVGQPRGMIARPGASFPFARATWQQQAQIRQQHHHQQTQQTHQMQNQHMAPQQVMMNPFTGPPMPNTARHPTY